MTKEKIDQLECHAETIGRGTFCPDPSPYHEELIRKAEIKAQAENSGWTISNTELRE